MSNPWKKVAAPSEVQALSDIMSEESTRARCVSRTHRTSHLSTVRITELVSDQHASTSNVIPRYHQHEYETSNVKEHCDSDAVLAEVLQNQFDREYEDELKVMEKKRNAYAKVSVSYANYFKVPKRVIYDFDSDEEDFDRFETNEKKFASLPKRRGYVMKDGEMVTKHDIVIKGRRNACRVMAIPPEV